MSNKNISKLANDAQSMASNPLSSVWVSASAGSGKTKVLKDRVLRLLLQGVAPHKIICLTFTKAAAGEMANRINDSLKKWAICSDEKLKEEITSLIGVKTLSDDQIINARKLFAIILNNPLNIQNLHSFCQKILKRFPLEAEISPHFEVIDEAKSQIILEESVIKSLHDKNLSNDINNILSIINEAQFTSLIQNITSHKNSLISLLNRYDKDINKELYNFFDTSNIETEKNIKEIFLKRCIFNDMLKDIVASHKDKTYMSIITSINIFLDPNTSLENKVKIYSSIFITQKLTPNKNTIKLFSKYGYEDLASREASACLEYLDKLNRLKMCKLNESFLNLAFSVIDNYEYKKDKLTVVDYNDLISKTLNLLKKTNINSWVMFKLDGGISHILIDEAQDTSPELWDIIRLLTEEFFVGESTEDDLEKTLFVVGDEKQSIYSFQGADLHLFQKMNRFFEQKILESKKEFSDVPMNTTFRFLPTITNFVDSIFGDGYNQGVSEKAVEHIAYREKSAGYIEVWDHIEKQKSEEEFNEEDYIPNLIEKNNDTGAGELMAIKIATKIESILNSKEIIPSTGKEVSPADILILVKSRKYSFLTPLYKELKKKSIPTEGSDRFKLKNELIVDDIISLLQFLLLPIDDLSLAELLKTPLINMNEEELFDLCYNRDKISLWEKLKQSKHYETISYLQGLLNKVNYLRPYEFLNELLNSSCPNDSKSAKSAFIKHIGESAKDTIEELLNYCIAFELNSVVSMQNFVHDLLHNSIEISREFDNSSKVKIMTIHGAKGLQSPIVFMPDTTLSNNFIKDTIFWNTNIPVWIPKESLSNSKSKPIKELYRQSTLEEYKRLLYVAITRAEDRLYIGSFGKGREESWITRIREVIANIGKETEDGFVIENKDFNEIKIKDNKIDRQECEKIDSSFLFNKIAFENMEDTPVSPSSIDDKFIISPFSQNDSIFFKRGLIIHKLLEILPSINDKNKACEEFLLNPKHNLTKEQAEQIKQEVLAIFSNYEYLFGDNTFSEVPVIGEINGVKYSGIIDRLAVLEDSVIILDYKSNRPPADSAEETPDIYKKQLSIYGDIIKSFYPNKVVKTAILWTNTSKLIYLNQK